MYATYEMVRRGTRPIGRLLDRGHRLANGDRNPLRKSMVMRAVAAGLELPARGLKDYAKPRYDTRKKLGDIEIQITPEVTQSLPFADLLRFDDALEFGGADPVAKPKVLIAAALSGHHATLLQDTVNAFVQDFDTYITDWKDARQVPVSEGDFGFDDYVEYLITFIETLGAGAHVVATCQAAPPAMVAVAVLAERNPAALPATLTLMGGPVDTRAAPTVLDAIIKRVPLSVFGKLNVQTIPCGHPGSGRRVYPGFVQLANFIGANPKPHVRQHARFLRNSVRGNETYLQKFRSFYDEYFAVLDMTERFYIETLQKVFYEHHIPTGRMEFRGKPVNFAAVSGMRLLTVEGANDHLCPPGQTEVAHGIFSSIPRELQQSHVQPGVGHYGVFSGSLFRREIYPVIKTFLENEPAKQIDTVRKFAA